MKVKIIIMNTFSKLSNGGNEMPSFLLPAVALEPTGEDKKIHFFSGEINKAER